MKNQPITAEQFQQFQRLYFIGIGGIGMSGLAQLLNAENKRVSGEDAARSHVTDILVDNGMKVTIGEGEELTDLDCVIFSGAIPHNHPTRLAAEQQGLPQLSYFEALGLYAEQFEQVIAIAGTHGKTTTTALTANLLVDAGFDPTALVGSLVREFGDTNARVGSADKQYFVVEACEHEAHMLELRPTTIIVNNIEADHLDYYRDLDHIVETFQAFVDLLPASEHARLIVNADDSRARELQTRVKRLTYGIEQVADAQALDVGHEAGRQFFTLDNERYMLHIPGEFNIRNSLAAITLGKELGISQNIIAESLAAFHGTWRRFEQLGEFHGATVISDYAHHPTAVRATIRAAKEFFPGKRIIAVFQPHQRSRTKELFDEFTRAFVEAEVVVLQEIYDVAGRDDAAYATVSSEHLVDALHDIQGQEVFFSQDAAVTRALLSDLAEHTDVIVVMGAGDIYRLAEDLAQKES